MHPQTFQAGDAFIARRYVASRSAATDGIPNLRFSWSNWGFGTEPIEVSVARLVSNRIRFIELHGNRYGPDLGYKTAHARRVLDDAGVAVSGICGMYGAGWEFASNVPHVRQRAIDYSRRQADFCAEMQGSHLLIVPGAVGRPVPFDDNEFSRAVESMRIVAEYLGSIGIRGAIEPIRPEEVSLCHTFADARRLIAAIDHPAVAYINGDLYHMLSGEEHVGQAILSASDLLINLHMADTNRRALGGGHLDVDVVLMALYAIGYNNREAYCTPEPLGAGSNPYRAMYGEPDRDALDELVRRTADTFFAREQEIRAASDAEIFERYPE